MLLVHVQFSHKHGTHCYNKIYLFRKHLYPAATNAIFETLYGPPDDAALVENN